VLYVAVIERLKAVFTVLVLNTYLQDATIFCDHSGVWNQMMIDKFTTDIKRTKTSNEMPFLLVLFLTLSFTLNFFCGLGTLTSILKFDILQGRLVW